MYYYSTNRDLQTETINGFTKKVSFKEALFTGQAPDLGLFMPETIPAVDTQFLASLRGKTYAEVAYEVLRRFLEDEIPEAELRRITHEAYTFDIPTQELDDATWIAWQDRGPTASFKDFAARFMARAIEYFLDPGQEVTILVATSGDTGSAIGEAFKGLEGITVYILYPKEEVSSIQKKQLDSIGENVYALAIDAKFDDCQRMVKEAFADPDLSDIDLTSANSINLGRILPQIVYYFYTWLQLAETEESPITFSVPSGNFGNSLGCEIARRMGLPVHQLIIATNENDEFPEFLQSGDYQKVSPSRKCLSNAMNVGNPSNLARYFELYGGTVDKEGVVHKEPDLEQMRRQIYTTAISDALTVETIKNVYRNTGIVIEPHGAVGIAALERFRKDHETGPAVVMETAHPSKFPEIIDKELGFTPDPHPFLKALEDVDQTEPYTVLPNDYEAFKSFLINR